jgi:hypothetical protein
MEVGEVTGSSDSGEVHGVMYEHTMPVELESPNGLITLTLGTSHALLRLFEQLGMPVILYNSCM